MELFTVGIICLLLGGLIGAFAVYFIIARKSQSVQSNISELQTTVALSNQRQSDLNTQLTNEKSLTQSLREALTIAQRELATSTTQFASAQQNVLEQRKLLEDAQHLLRNAFASASAEALAKNNEAFLQLAKERFATISAEATGSLDQRKEQIDALLKPMRELMGQYQTRVVEIEKSRVESYSMLREQLGTLTETQRTLNTQTSQLVTALSRPTVRGQWGEISLRRLVELAGLTARCDFIEQLNVDTDEGRIRPDMVVHLPGGRDVVIDCKACLDAFLDAASCADEDIRRGHLQRHAQQVRTRARELSAKSYWSQFSRSPEYVVMFLPGEAFLYSACEHDPALIEDFLKSRVIVATPTTLIALLKSIEFGWRQEAITQNAEEIRKLGVDLYDRIAIVLSHLSKLGGSISNSVGHYNAALASLETRVMVSARKMGELGARSNKELADPNPIDIVPREIAGTLFVSEAAE